MKKLLLSACFAIVGSAAMACPDYTARGVERYSTTGAELWSPAYLEVRAGGDRNLSRCRIDWSNRSTNAAGWVIIEPDFSINVRDLDGYELEFRVISDCDTVLAVNTAARNWYYDDDDGERLNAKIRLTNPASSGVYDIWVGTYDGETCDAELVLETF